jgi:UDP-GlcNAc:undecaprenyl-phosphate/decaprenyl-phosphate GlcNAc-1-phosphate transferase
VRSYLIVGAIAAGVTLVATPLVRLLAIKLRIIDQPSDRKVHPRPTPTSGGLAMYLGFVAALAYALFMPFYADVRQSSTPLGALVTCTLIVILGVIDDAKGVRALTKLTGQIFVGGILVLLAVQLVFFPLPGLGIVSLSGDLGIALTIVYVIAIVNAINLVDGLDGLAAGVVAIAAGVFFVYVWRSPSLIQDAAQGALLLSAITVGVCVGFLPWNFNPAKIFMGDSGAMLLGMLLSIATISGLGKSAPAPGDYVVIAGVVVVPVLVLFVPFLDVALAIIRRTRHGVGIAQADKQHIHHRLMDIGHGHKQAVLLMYLWSGLLAGSALAVGLIDGQLVAGLITLGAGLLFVLTALPRFTEKRRNGHGARGHAEASGERANAPASSDAG